MHRQTQTDVVTETLTRHCPLYRVLIHNDDKSTMEFVMAVLVEIFHLEMQKALTVMLEAHEQGVALVTVETLEQAEFHVDQVQSIARAQKFPLKLTYEPAE